MGHGQKCDRKPTMFLIHFPFLCKKNFPANHSLCDARHDRCFDLWHVGFFFSELRDFEPDDQQEIEVDEGNTAVIECHLPESQPKAQVRYSVKQEWLETSKGLPSPNPPRSFPLPCAIFIISWNATAVLSEPIIKGPDKADYLKNVQTWQLWAA